MRTKKTILIAFLFICFSFNYAFSQHKRYLVKSGKVEYKWEGNISGTTVLYWDNYGEKEAKFEETTGKMFGMTTHSKKLTILLKDIAYGIDLKTKKGSKIKMAMLTALYDDGNGKSYDQLLQSYGFNKVGSEKILGYDCEKWSGITKFSAYKRVPLRESAKIMGITSAFVAVKFEPNIPIPAEKFEIPKDVKIMDMEQMMGRTMNDSTDTGDDEEMDDESKEMLKNMKNLKNLFNSGE